MKSRSTITTRARNATRNYHKELYTHKELFQKGSSWLEKPNRNVLNAVNKNLEGKRGVKVLDLGAGVGRNAIPIAKIIGAKGVEVTCVDYLKIAIDKLSKYAKAHDVSKFIKGIVSPIEDFVIVPNTYDFIVAHSVLTHTKSKNIMIKTIKDMARGTKENGMVYIYMITNSKEFNLKTGKEQDPESEVRISSKEATTLLKEIFTGWTVQMLEVAPYEEKFIKKGKDVLWKVDYLTFIAKAPATK